MGQFIGELDALDLFSEVMVVSATNRLDLVDPALLNPGRLGLVVEMTNPDRGEREEILQVHTRHLPLAGELDYPALAEAAEGKNGAELAAACQRATFEALRRFIAAHGEEADQASGEFAITQAELLDALNAARPAGAG